MVDPIKGCTEINLHNFRFLPALQCTLQCMGHAQKCITESKTFPLSNMGGWKRTTSFHKSSKTYRHQALKPLRQYLCHGNWSEIGNRGGRRTFRNWSAIGLSVASRNLSRRNNYPDETTRETTDRNRTLLRTHRLQHYDG